MCVGGCHCRWELGACVVPFTVPPNIKEFSFSYCLCDRLMIQRDMVENLREADDKFSGIIGLLAPHLEREDLPGTSTVLLSVYILL